MTTTTASRSSGSTTPSSTASSDSSHDLAIAQAITNSLNAIKAARARAFHQITQTTVLHGCGGEGVSERIEIAVTAQKPREPAVQVTHLPQETSRATVAAEATAPADRLDDAGRINEALEKVPKRVVPRRGMSSDYGIAF